MEFSISHFGVCVTDLARSLRFWRDGLGFATVSEFTVGTDFARTLEVDGEVEAVSHLLARDGVTVELLHFVRPPASGEASATRGQIGLTHLCLRVDDVNAVAVHLVEHGATVLPDTRTTFSVPGWGDSHYLFVADPDGVRVELMQLPR